MVATDEVPVIDQSDSTAETWIAAGGDPRDQGRMAELISRELTGADFMVGVAWLSPGDVHLLHHHPHADEWYYVIAGSGIFTVGDRQVRGERGTSLFIPAGTSHRIHNDRADELHIAWGFNRESLADVGFVWDE
ncbi:MAG TPA: cupin domain-containing protein [Solirubrobacteraceae bacterium]|nr:cupin domain-containing protein [Solirubrobacteraceae bacterium]